MVKEKGEGVLVFSLVTVWIMASRYRVREGEQFC